MLRAVRMIVVAWCAVLCSETSAQIGAVASTKYKALKYPPPTLGTTWAILQRDGANREVEPYLSSLGQGESGTGVVTSPPFTIADDTISFTIRGHDGQGGGGGANYIALVDSRKGKTLHKTAPPGNDALQVRSWDVSSLQGVEVRIEVHDGDGGGAFAWLGVGEIEAGPALKVNFRKGMPDGWERPAREASVRYDTVSPGLPFKRNAAAFSLIPNTGQVELPCGFVAQRLFLLGCTANGGRPLDTCGGIEIHYAGGAADVVPLMVGFSLDRQYKLPGTASSLHLHPSADPYQAYLVLEPRNLVIEKIRLVAGPDRGPVPRITAITCETEASSEHLMPLPACVPAASEAAWMESHAISTDSFDLNQVMDAVRAAYHLPPIDRATGIRFHKQQLDANFRSEGVALADLNGDGHLDVAAGNAYYTGPDWKIHGTLDELRAYPCGAYSDAFLCFADDLNRDDALDLIIVGFPGRETHWLENPGKADATWKRHLAVAGTGSESPAYLDVDGDHQRELVFIHGGRCSLARPAQDPRLPWRISPIANTGDPSPGHGLGVGDVNRDGRRDVLIPNGWWENPADKGEQPWRFHAAELFGGAQLCVWDFDGDGDNDVLGSSAHGYGIAWSEQTPDGWQVHEIENKHSQTHALHLADINGDGLMDFVTGKRFWAHNGRDPGSFQPSVLCWYELVRDSADIHWIPHEIDVDSGVGLHFQVIDIDDDDRLDIVTSNKKGVHLFRQIP